MRMKVPVKKKKLDDCAKFQNVDQQCVHIKQNTIRQRRRRKLLKKRKELHSDCSLYESWPRETYVTYARIYVRRSNDISHNKHCRSNSKKQLGDITIDNPPSFPTILYIYTVFVSHCAPPVCPPHWPLFAVEPKSNQPNKQKKLW